MFRIDDAKWLFLWKIKCVIISGCHLNEIKLSKIFLKNNSNYE